MIGDPATLLFVLLLGHALADFPLQGDFMAKTKAPSSVTGSGGVWVWALLWHAWINAGAVWLITGRLDLALGELFAHALIDYAKCRGWLNFHIDQAAHIGCKIIWWLFITTGA